MEEETEIFSVKTEDATNQKMRRDGVRRSAEAMGLNLNSSVNGDKSG